MPNIASRAFILADIVSQQFIHDTAIRQMLLELEQPAARIAWLCQALQPGD